MKKEIFVKLFCLTYFFNILLFTEAALANQTSSYLSLLKEMFTKVTLERNGKAIPLYYDKDFKLYSNGKIMNYEQFLKQHKAIFKTSIQYKVRYEEDTFIEQGMKISGRIFITTQSPNKPAHEIEVILIAEYKNNKLYRLWELTFPDWSQMTAFKNSS
jgi:hypothetical protein